MTLTQEWKSYSRYTKIVLSIYLLLSLPLQPVLIVLAPFSWWVTAPDGVPHRRMTIVEYLSLSIAFSVFSYVIVLLVWLL